MKNQLYDVLRFVSPARAGALVALLLVAPATTSADVKVFADVEGAAAWAGGNDVRIPGDGGTDLSLVNDLSSGVAPTFRARMGVVLTERHIVFGTYAPVRLGSRGTLPRETIFAGETFAAGSAVEARFKFDSYRLTYRYGLVRSERIDFDLGATAFLRDAAISLQGAQFAEKANVGFVPLLSFRFAWRFAPPFALVVDGDALAAPQGRAEDVLAAVEVALRDGVAVRAGYRIIEGGADNAEVYTFALIHLVGVGLTVRL
jgi:hypothetical protein